MTDNTNPPIAAPIPVAAEAPQSPPAAPAAASEVSLLAAAAPGAAPSTPPEEAAPKPEQPPAFRETLLEREDAARKAAAAPEPEVKPDAPDAAKAGEAAKPEAPAKSEAKPEGQQPPKPEVAPTVDLDKYEFKIPETVKADPAAIGEFKSILKEGLANPAEAGQKLLDLYAKAATEFAAQTRRDQFDVFNATTAAWDKKVLADPEFGGAGHATASAAVARVRDALISSAPFGSAKYKADLAEYEEFVRVTGAGSHPALWRILHNAAAFVDQPQASSLPVDIKPPRNIGRPPRGSMYSEESRQKMNGT